MDVRAATGNAGRHTRRRVAARVRDTEADVDHEGDLHDVDLAAVVGVDDATWATLLFSLTPVAFASPSETDDELLVPVVVDAPPVVAPAIAPIEAVAARVARRARRSCRRSPTLCCSAAFVDELDEPPEDEEDEHPLPSPDELLPEATPASAAVAD